jgi:Ca-activated chloride channel family protein
MSAIEQVDQMADQAEPGEPETGEGGDPAGTSGGSSMMLMEQLLDQVEGNPAYLMRNQFRLEEQRLMSARRGQLYEPRPW